MLEAADTTRASPPHARGGTRAGGVRKAERRLAEAAWSGRRMTPGEPVDAPPRRRTHIVARLLGEARLHYRSGVALVGLLLLVVVVTMPFTLSSIWDEMTGPPEGEVFHIGPAAESSANPTYARLHLAMVVF